jgi:hypothetical protein
MDTAATLVFSIVLDILLPFAGAARARNPAGRNGRDQDRRIRPSRQAAAESRGDAACALKGLRGLRAPVSLPRPARILVKAGHPVGRFSVSSRIDGDYNRRRLIKPEHLDPEHLEEEAHVAHT